MQLLIKQRVFSWTDTYDIYDEWNNPKYFVKAEFFSLTHQLHVYDNNDREIGIIHQKMFTFLLLLKLRWTVRYGALSRRNFPFSIPSTKLITGGGMWKGTSSAGIMMFTMPAAP